MLDVFGDVTVASVTAAFVFFISRRRLAEPGCLKGERTLVDLSRGQPDDVA